MTTEQLLREISQLEKIVNLQFVAVATEMEGVKKLTDEKFLAQHAAMTTALSAAEKAVQAALLAAEKAVDKANVASEKRFEAVNAFRGQLNDVVTTLISRAEAEARMTALGDQLVLVRSSVEKSIASDAAARSTARDYWGYVVGIVGVVSMVVTLFLAVKP